MKQTLMALFIVSTISISNCSQTSPKQTDNASQEKVGGQCEGCEAIHESPVAFDKLSHLCWLPDWNDKGTKLERTGEMSNLFEQDLCSVIAFIATPNYKNLIFNQL